jgi:hypothetical protein
MRFSESLFGSVRPGLGCHSYGSSLAESVMPVTVSSSAIGTDGSGELKFAKFRQRT